MEENLKSIGKDGVTLKRDYEGLLNENKELKLTIERLEKAAQTQKELRRPRAKDVDAIDASLTNKILIPCLGSQGLRSQKTQHAGVFSMRAILVRC